MAGVSFDLLAGAVIFLAFVWGLGRVFRMVKLPAILGELFAGIILGPNFLDVVPFSSDGNCDTVLYDSSDQGSGDGSTQGRMLAASGNRPACLNQFQWTPRWEDWGDGQRHLIETSDIWSFAGTIGVMIAFSVLLLCCQLGCLRQFR